MRPALTLILPGLLLACDPAKDDTKSEFLDRDNDGFPETEDCNDLDAQIHPDAVEICDNIDNDCDGVTDEEDAFDAPAWFVDADGDGFGQDGEFIYACEQPQGYTQDRTDCNDNDLTAYPGAAEVCDDVDNDCDGVVDEGTALDAQLWYRDGDEDGYGAELASVKACNQPDGYVEDNTDCNDGNPDMNPGADEICNDIDDDCDTLVDDADPGVISDDNWIPDADGDQWGEEGATWVMACLRPLGYVHVDQEGDCDDSDPVVNPDQAEICGDDIDNDCDGNVDEPDAPNLLAWYTDNDGDGYGAAGSTPVYACDNQDPKVPNDLDCYDYDADINPDAEEICYDGTDQNCDGESDYDCDLDGFDSSDFGGADCDDGEVLANPDRAEVCGDGLDNDCNGDTDPCGLAASLYGEADGDAAGTSVGGGGDVNGDGKDDVVIGAPYHNSTLIEDAVAVGSVYIVYGPSSATASLTSGSDGIIEGATEQDQLGSAVAIVGDQNRDGMADVLAGAFGEDSGGATAGAAYLFSGPFSGTISADDAIASFFGEIADDRAGSAVANAGDIDGDRTADLLIGAFQGGLSYGTEHADAGYAYLIYGPATGEIDLSFADTRFIGVNGGENAGTSLDGAGDFNGDGTKDIVIGAPFARPGGVYYGAAYVVYGPPPEGDVSLEEADRTYRGVNSGDTAGYSVAGIGDMNGDGRDDIAVGAPQNDAGAEGSGAVYIMAGAASSGSLSGATAILVGEDRDDSAGSSVSKAGDIDGDDVPDVLVGAKLDDYGGSNAGAGYVVFGPLLGTVDLSDAPGKVIGEADNDFMGAAISTAGDTDGDGADDFVVGAEGSDGNGANSGAAYIIRGGGW